jgi:beta-lactam-binding protein with PASTA domain
LWAALVLLAIIAVLVIVALVISHSASPDSVQLKQIVARDAQSAISQLRSLVHQNTK